MKITKREFQIINIIEKSSPDYVTSRYIAEKLNMSIRTIQSDLKNVRKIFNLIESANIQSVRSKGTRIIISDFEKYSNEILSHTNENHSNDISTKNGRVKYIIQRLLNKKGIVTRNTLLNELHISESTLYNDISNVKNILNTRRLSLTTNSKLELNIEGSEANKRKILVYIGEKNNFDDKYNYHNEINNLVLNILLSERHKITEKTFNNLILHLEISMERMQEGHLIEKSKEFTHTNEYKIAKKTLNALGKKFNFKINQHEINNLAIQLKGKSEYENNDYISNKVNDFIYETLSEIDGEFNQNLSDYNELILTLGLHVTPLITRIKYNMQLTNDLLFYIKKSFPLAFDIAIFIGHKLQNLIGKEIYEDEIAYIAVHINNYLINYNKGNKKILIITNIKRSERILLKQRFYTWFTEEIKKLKFVDEFDVEEVNLEEYDVVFSTESEERFEKYAPIKISQFPDTHEYSNIKLAIDGFKNKEDILNLISKDLYYYGNLKNEDEVWNKMSELLKKELPNKSDELINATKEREIMGNTYFGNNIAFPHPITPLSLETFLMVILTPNDIIWNEDGNTVNLIVLVVIEKNNAKTFQLWNYISLLIEDKNLIENILQDPTYEKFIRQIRLLL